MKMPPNYESHIVPRRPFILPLQGCMILLSAVVVGLTAYAVSFNNVNISDNGNGSDTVNGGDGNGFALGIVSFHLHQMYGDLFANYHLKAIATIVLVGYFFLTEIVEGVGVTYHRFLVLLLILAGFFCWIAVFITLTEKLAGTSDCVKNSNGIVTCTRKSDVDGMPWRNEMIAADAIAGVML